MKKIITIILTLTLGVTLNAQTTYWVTNNNDSGAGSLRETVDNAGYGDIVRFDQSLLGQTITLTSGRILLDFEIKIIGLYNQTDTLKISGGNNQGIFQSNDFGFSLDSMCLINSYDDFGAIVLVSHQAGTQVFIDNCFFYNNTSTVSGGGAINMGAVVGWIELITDNSIFINNNNLTSITNNANGGGAISMSASGSSTADLYLTVDSCLFRNNSSLEDGGAIDIGSWGISNLYVLNSQFENNESGNAGGAIIGNGITVLNSSFLNNHSDDDGGAIVGASSIISSVFTNNTSDENGGAIYEFSSTDSCVIIDSDFNGNTSNNGGALHIGTGSFLNCTFSNNSAALNAGALHIKTGNFLNCTFSDNSAGQNGGALEIEDGYISNCTFSNNNATLNGGATYSESYNGANIDSSIFSFNNAVNGGAIYFECNPNDSLNINYCLFNENSATNNGGAINTNALSSINHCEFTSNAALNNGGGIYASGEFSTFKITVKNSTFGSNNAINQDGGALFILSDYNLNTIELCTFDNNFANNQGGALMATTTYQSLILLKNLTFNNNYTTNNNETINYGTIYPWIDSLMVVGSIINGEIAAPDSTVLSLGYNIFSQNNTAFLISASNDQIGTNPLLGNLQNNGGFTQTILPNPNSPAIDAGNPSDNSFAQNGIQPVGIRDVGAAESTNIPSSVVFNSIEKLKVYPNPSIDVFNISLESKPIQNIQVRVINSLGKIIILENIKQFSAGTTYKIDLQNYSKGVYSLEIITETEVMVKKLILQ